MQFLQVGCRSRIQPRGVRFRRVIVFLQLASDVVAQFIFPFQRQRNQFVANGSLFGRAFRIGLLLIDNEKIEIEFKFEKLRVAGDYRFCIHNLRILEILGADKIAAERGRNTSHDGCIVSLRRVIFRLGHVAHEA